MMLLRITPCLIIILLLETHCTGQEIESFPPEIAVDVHNNYRRLEGSSNMKALQWDEEIASGAAAYAKNCDFAHEQGLKLGENLHLTTGQFDTSSIESAITNWYNEKNDYNFSTKTCAPKKQCGHYTQVVWANTERIGCAAVSCSSVTNGFTGNPAGLLVICRYSPQGNFVGQSPMKKGVSCTECDSGSVCDNGLCATATPTPKPLPPTTAAVADTFKPTKPTKFTPPLPDPKPTIVESSKPITTTKGVTTPAKMGTTDGPMATKPHFTPSKPTSTGKPPYSTESPTSTAPLPQWSCSEEYSRMLRDYNALMEDYQKEFYKWKDMTSGKSCSQND